MAVGTTQPTLVAKAKILASVIHGLHLAVSDGGSASDSAGHNLLQGLHLGVTARPAVRLHGA